MRRVKLLRARTGTYIDKKTGQEKSSYATIGSVLEKETGERMYKIDIVPVNFDGWVYEGDLPSEQMKAQPQQEQTFDDDIPF